MAFPTNYPPTQHGSDWALPEGKRGDLPLFAWEKAALGAKIPASTRESLGGLQRPKTGCGSDSFASGGRNESQEIVAAPG
jgi:hypothetical protein